MRTIRLFRSLFVLCSSNWSYAAYSSTAGMCSCVNPMGVCVILCAGSKGAVHTESPLRSGFSPFQIGALGLGANSLPLGVSSPASVGGAPSLGDIGRGVLAPRIFVPEEDRYRLPEAGGADGRPLGAYPLQLCKPVVRTKEVTSVKTHTKTSIRIFTKAVPVTVRVTVIKTQVPAPVTSILTVQRIITEQRVQMVTATSTLPAVTKTVTHKELHVITVPPSTVLKTIRESPAVSTKTRTVTVSSTAGEECRGSASAKPASTAHGSRPEEYIDIKPLEKGAKGSGVAIEFHNAENRVKRVNVFVPATQIDEKNTAAKEPPYVTVTRLKNIFRTREIMIANTAPSTSTAEKAAKIQPHTLSGRTVTVEKQKFLTVTKTVKITETVTHTSTITRTSQATVTEVKSIQITKTVPKKAATSQPETPSLDENKEKTYIHIIEELRQKVEKYKKILRETENSSVRAP